MLLWGSQYILPQRATLHKCVSMINMNADLILDLFCTALFAPAQLWERNAKDATKSSQMISMADRLVSHVN